MVQGVAFGDRIWPVRGVRAMNLQAVADARPRIDDETSLRQKNGSNGRRIAENEHMASSLMAVLTLHIRADVHLNILDKRDICPS